MTAVRFALALLLGVIGCRSPTPSKMGPPAATSPAAGGVAIAKPTARVGERVTRVEDLTMTLTVSGGGDIHMVKHTEELREILEVEGITPTKVRAHYAVHDHQQSMDGKTQDARPPHTGKTYVVWREGDVVRATFDAGGEVPADELAAVTDDHSRLGKADGLDLVLASRTWTIGEGVTFTPSQLALLNEGRSASETYASMVLTLTRVDGDVATFAMEAGALLKLEVGTLKLTIAGAIRVDVARGHLLELAGSGPVKGDLGMPVTGTMSVKIVSTRTLAPTGGSSANAGRTP